MIEYVKTSATNEKILAAQQIASFFRYFPNYEDLAFDAIVDLCESADVDVRKRATYAMMQICRDCKHFVSKAADILIQLYQTNQASEVTLINSSLSALLELDIQKFLQSFFTNFEEGNEVVRERALKFLSSKIQSISESSLTKEAEEQLLDYSKKAMEDVTKDEFLTFIGILTKLKISKTATGQSMIVSAIKSQAELKKPFDPNDTDFLDKFLLCTKHTIPLLSQYNRASEYINFICINLLPNLSVLAEKGNDLPVLQALAEMSPYILDEDSPSLIDLDKCLDSLYKKLIEFLAKPPTEEVESAKVEAKSENVENTGDTAAKVDDQEPEAKSVVKKQEAEIHFTHIEYLLYAFHHLGRVRPSFLSEALFQEIKPRLQGTSDGCKRYMERLDAQLKNVKPADLMKEENKLRSIALKTTKNITLMIKDLFYKPPQFTKSTISLSFKPTVSRLVENSPTANSNNNNGSGKPAPYKGPYNAGKYRNERQVGQKHKYRQNYTNDRFKRQRNAR